MTAQGSLDAFIQKLDSNGNFVWAKQISGTNGDWGFTISTDDANHVYTCGIFLGTTDFNPGAGTFNVTSNTSTYDVYVSKLDDSGNFMWAQTFGGANHDYSYSLTVNGKNVYTTGHFLSTVDFNPGPGIFNISSSGNTDIFIHKLSQPPTIASFTPASGSIGTAVTITGTNFSATPSDNMVTFNGVAATVTACTATSLTTTVPTGSTTGPITVTIGSLTATSSGNFTVLCGPDPTITSFSPASGTIGTTVIITGTNFSTISGDNVVTFNGTGSIVTASTTTSITTTVPAGATGTGAIAVTVGCSSTTTSSSNFTICPPAPRITSFSPTTGAVGDPFTITGTNFSTIPSDNLVDFNGTPGIVTASSATSITTEVPDGAITGPITVSIGCSSVISTTDFIVDCGPVPTITSFSPSSGVVGSLVTITGTDFSTTPADNLVDFNGISATVTASTSTSITVEVPAGATTGPISIGIDCNYITSTVDFDVTAVIVITNQPSDAIACEGTIATFSTTATGAGNITYQWQYSPDGIVAFTDIVNGGSYSNAATSTLSVNTSGNSGEGRYRCRISGDLATSVITVDKELTIIATPAAPSVNSTSRCGDGSVTLNATGGTAGQYRWYTVPSGGIAIDGEVNSTYTTPILSATTTYYATIVSNNCESQRTPVTVTIVILPSAPNTVGASACPGSMITLTASGGINGQYKWYNSETGGTPFAGEVNDSYTTPELMETTSYFVSVTDNGCESLRTSVTATIITIGCAPQITVAALTTEPGGKIILDLKPLITTIGTLLVSSIKVKVIPLSGALTIIENGILTIDYTATPFSGTEFITIEACNTNGICSQQDYSIEVVGGMMVYNAVTPNGDDKNSIFRLNFIDLIPETKTNEVFIYNRWGAEVFSISDYDNKTRVFAGLTNDGNKLPAGIYFYKIMLPLQNKTLTGFLDLRY